MIINPIAAFNSHRQHTLTGITVAEVQRILGFAPNVVDDPDKVENSWAFSVDGIRCAVWDYKGSHHRDVFSAFGPDDTLRELFQDNLLTNN